MPYILCAYGVTQGPHASSKLHGCCAWALLQHSLTQAGGLSPNPPHTSFVPKRVSYAKLYSIPSPPKNNKILKILPFNFIQDLY